MNKKLQRRGKNNNKNSEDQKTIKLDLIHSYGAAFDSNISDCCYFIQHDIPKIIYPIGRYVAVKNLDKTDKKYDIEFLKLDDKIIKVDSMCMSQDRSKLAVAQRLRQQKGPTVFVYDMNNDHGKFDSTHMVNHVFQDTKSEAFVTMDFSSKESDPKFLACVTDSMDTHIVFYNLQKDKSVVINSIQKRVMKVRICPGDNQTLSVSGPELFKIFRVFDSSMRGQTDVVRLDQKQNFTDHAWIGPNYIGVGTDKGKMFIVGKKEQKFTLFHTLDDIFNDKQIGVSCITPFSKGLMVASTFGNFSLLMKDQEATEEEDRMKLKLEAYFKPPRSGWKVISMDFNKEEDKVAIAFSNNQIAFINSLELINGESPMVPIKMDEHVDDMRRKMKSVKFTYLYKGFHFGEIDHLDICTQRPLVATCSNSDSYVRIWNYMDFKCELSFFFRYDTLDGDVSRPLLSLAFHPNGYYIALGLTSTLRMMMIMDDRPYEYRDISIKGATQLKFSNGGQYLAVCYPRQKSTYYIVTVINSFTLEFVRTVRGNIGIVNDIYWSSNDMLLYICTDDGNLCVLNLNTLQEEYFPDHTCMYRSVAKSKAGTVYLTGFEKTGDKYECFIRDKDDVTGTSTYKMINDNLTNICFLNTYLGHQAILVGTEQGELKIYSENLIDGAYDEVRTHIGKVNKIIASPNGRYIFSVGEDGLLNIYQVTNYRNGIELMKDGDETEGGEMNLKSVCTKRELADIVLVDKKDIQLYKDQLEKHKQEIENLNTKLEHKAMEVKNQLQEEKRLNMIKLKQESEKWHERYNELVQEKKNIDNEKTNLLKNNDENYLKAVEDLEALYEKKLNYENEKYLKLEQDLLEERLNNEKRFNEMQAKNDDIIEKLRVQFKSSYEDANRIYRETKQDAKNLEAEYNERLAQQEEEHELEIRELNARHKKEIEKLSKEISKKTTEKDSIEHSYQEIINKNEVIVKKMKDKDQEIAKLGVKVREKMSRIDKLKKELEDARENLRKKEKQIYDAKSKINDLQKAKHVLSFRTTEMRKSLEPKEAQIEKLKEELYKLEGEFENMLKTSHKQKEDLETKTDQFKTLEGKYKKQIMITKKKESLLNQMKMAIFNCVNIKEHKKMIKALTDINTTFVKKEGLKQEKYDPRGIEEMMRQIQYLEKSIHQINIATDKLVKNREMQIMKRTKDNIQLIKDLNTMRRENKDLNSQNNSLNIRYRNLESTNKKLKSEIENYQKTIERMKKSKIRGAKGATGMTSSRPISRQSIKELKETKKHYQILEMVKNKPTRARNLIVKYQKEIQNLRSKLRSLNVPEDEVSVDGYNAL